jgi:tRNA (mo5U34)-methyltransferase
VLDVGAWDGWFSFEAERRGAARVLATDSWCWGGPGRGTQAGFLLARDALDSQVEALEIDVFDLSPEHPGVFDVVLFLGVLYHLRDPERALAQVASVTSEVLVVETAVDLIDRREPAMAFYPGDELEGDSTNWWAPNPSALCEMLRAAGFEDLTLSWGPRSLAGRIRRSLVRHRCLPDAWRASGRRDRMTVHARRTPRHSDPAC